jgi:hypothetical protein
LKNLNAIGIGQGTKDLLSNVTFILFIGILIRIFVSFSIIGGIHADEVFQGLEMAYNMVWPSDTNIISWEFQTQTRSYLIPLLFIPIVLLFSLFSINLFLLQVIRFLFSCINLLTVPLSRYIFNLSKLEEKNASIIVNWFFALYIPFIIISNYLGADNLALFLLLIFIFYLSHSNKSEITNKQLFLSGIFIGIIISFRLQFSIILIPFLIKKVYVRQLSIFYGVLIGLLPLLITDYIFYGLPGISAFNFLQYNVITQKNASIVPESFWWLYILTIPLLLLYGGLGIPIIVFRIFKSANKQINDLQLLALGSVVYILFFQFLTYKEVRFIIPALIIILLDSFQSLPLLIANYKKGIYKRKIQIYSILLILSVPLSLIITPYNYDLKDNLWLAQEKIRSLDPANNSSIGIIDPFYRTGGYFFQYGNNFSKKIYFMNEMNETEINETMKYIHFLINDQNHIKYSLVTAIKNEFCTRNILIKNFTYIREFSFDWINYIYNPNRLGINIELWRCN